MMEFTVEEISLIESMISEYKLTRITLIKQIMRSLSSCKDEPEIYDVMVSAAEKLGNMTDEEYENYEFSVQEVL
ncbi:MAG: hypothetical protein IJ619_10495 [Eubacterium sp.]|nr:hypothetical protein [Eubacterium sp.]